MKLRYSESVWQAENKRELTTWPRHFLPAYFSHPPRRFLAFKEITITLIKAYNVPVRSRGRGGGGRRERLFTLSAERRRGRAALSAALHQSFTKLPCAENTSADVRRPLSEQCPLHSSPNSAYIFAHTRKTIRGWKKKVFGDTLNHQTHPRQSITWHNQSIL